jgi:hypothetical protein
MSTQSIVILPDTAIELNVTGPETRADAWYGLKDGLHTVTFHLENFTGRIFIEASLETIPASTDWFSVYLNGAKDYMQYPIDPLAPISGSSGDTFVDAYTFQGNFLWLRARVDRSYYVPAPATDDEKSALGSVKKVLLNH